jgi:hypothetical protein
LLGRPRSWPGRDGEEKRNPYPARNWTRSFNP